MLKCLFTGSRVPKFGVSHKPPAGAGAGGNAAGDRMPVNGRIWEGNVRYSLSYLHSGISSNLGAEEGLAKDECRLCLPLLMEERCYLIKPDD